MVHPIFMSYSPTVSLIKLEKIFRYWTMFPVDAYTRWNYERNIGSAPAYKGMFSQWNWRNIMLAIQVKHCKDLSK